MLFFDLKEPNELNKITYPLFPKVDIDSPKKDVVRGRKSQKLLLCYVRKKKTMVIRIIRRKTSVRWSDIQPEASDQYSRLRTSP